MTEDELPWERKEREYREAREEQEEAEAVAGEEDIDPDICPECEKETSKFMGECEHCGFNRWDDE